MYGLWNVIGWLFRTMGVYGALVVRYISVLALAAVVIPVHLCVTLLVVGSGVLLVIFCPVWFLGWCFDMITTHDMLMGEVKFIGFGLMGFLAFNFEAVAFAFVVNLWQGLQAERTQ